VIRTLDALPGAVVRDASGVAALLADPDVRRPPPEHGRPLAELLTVLDRAAAKGIKPPSGGYLAFIPGSGLVSAAVADLLADVLNRYTGLADLAPVLVAMELDLLRWLADLFGLPAGAGGIFTTGGSLAALSAMITMRSERLGEDFGSATVYCTDQVHASARKALRLAGFPARAVRVVPTDGALRLDPEALRSTVRSDRAARARPACVIASAGSTNTGTVDPLSAVADVARSEDLWLHVDAAYGGFFQLTERGRRRLAGIEHADSVVLDPHKGLFLPFGTGCLLVRDADALRRAHSGDDAHYLDDVAGGELPNFGDTSPELSRDFRGLRVWLPLHLHGVAAFRAALDEKLDLAAWAHGELAADPHLAVLGPPDLSTVAFRVAAPAAGSADATAEVLRRVNAEGPVLLSSTRIGGTTVGRICILGHRTGRDHVEAAVGAVRRHAAAVSQHR
jgi:aromatic-L-amino-acid decarboxylase